MKMTGKLRRFALAGAATALISVGAGIGITDAGASSSSANWTIKVPNLVSSSPNFIYPFLSGAYFSVSNMNDFQALMYRPLYWFGQTNSIAMNPQLSMANAPVWSNNNKTVTITLKSGYTWTNGEKVDAGDLMLWMNLMASDAARYAGYNTPLSDSQPLNIPELISSISEPGGDTGQTVVMNLTASVSPTWFLYNQLSQITLMPKAWDLMPSTETNPASTSAADVAAWKGSASNLPALTAVSSAGGNFSTKSAGCWGGPYLGNNFQNHTATPSIFAQHGLPSNITHASAVADGLTDTQLVDQAAKCYSEVEMMRSFGADTANFANTSTDTGKLFSIVDGPWKLSQFDPNAPTITMVPNTAFHGVYSPAKALDFVPCTDEQSCYNLLLSGQVDSGSLPYTYAHKLTGQNPATAAPTYQPAALKAKGYKMVVGYSWQFVYASFNFNSTQGGSGRAGAMFKQTYIRQVLNELFDQKSMISLYEHGYSFPTVGPVPVYPKNAYSSSLTQQIFPFSVTKAISTLKAHGWKVVPGGVTTCAKPGTSATECGAGIKAGDKLSFQYLYATGSNTLKSEVAYFAADAKKAGIQINTTSNTFDNVIGVAYGGGGNWDIADWGGGWLYAPDYLPTGEALFATGAGSNNGNYSDKTADKLISGTVFGGATLAAYNKYIATSDPVLWKPLGVSLGEIKSNITGTTPNPLGAFAPELWRLK